MSSFFGLKYNKGCDSSRGLLAGWYENMSISILVCLYSYRNNGNLDNNLLKGNHILIIVFKLEDIKIDCNYRVLAGWYQNIFHNGIRLINNK